MIRFFHFIKKNFITLIPLLILLVLTFYSLGDRSLFLDESSTVILGERVSEFGYPRSWNGDYFYTDLNGNDFNNNFIAIRYPWLQYYIAALGMKFSNSLFFVRFLFAVCGILSAYVFYRYALTIVSRQRIAIIALWLYSLSVPLMLMFRTARYYAPSMLFMLSSLYIYNRYITTLKKRYLILLSVILVLLFHTFHLFFFITLVTILLCYFIYDRKKESMIPLGLGMFVVFIFTFPFFAYYVYFNKVIIGSSRESLVSLKDILVRLLSNLALLNTYISPFITLILLYFIVFLLNKKRKKNTSYIQKREFILCWLMFFTNLIIVSSFGQYYGYRFLLACYPSLFILSGILIDKMLNIDRIFSYVVIALIVFSNILGQAPYIAICKLSIDPRPVENIIKAPIPDSNYNEQDSLPMPLTEYIGQAMSKSLGIRFYLTDYIYEITHNYKDNTKGIVEFLKENADSDDIVLINQYYIDTINIYTGLKTVSYIDKNGYTNKVLKDINDDTQLVKLYKNFPNTNMVYELSKFPLNRVDWIIEVNHEKSVTNYGNYLKENDLLDQYQLYILDDCYSKSNFPEVYIHDFKENTSLRSKIFIYKRIDRDMPGTNKGIKIRYK